MNIKFCSENQKIRDQSEDLGTDEKVILECILLEVGCEVVDWVHLFQNSDYWWALLNISNERCGIIKGWKFLD